MLEPASRRSAGALEMRLVGTDFDGDGGWRRLGILGFVAWKRGTPLGSQNGLRSEKSDISASQYAHGSWGGARVWGEIAHVYTVRARRPGPSTICSVAAMAWRWPDVCVQ